MYSPFRYIRDIFWKTRPIHLTFFVTRRCNSRCPFCFYLKSRSIPPEHPLPELSVPEIEKVSSSLGRLLWLAFSGGEIFLRQDLAEIARIFYRNNKPSIMLFPSNGMMPERIRDGIEEVLRSCPNSVVALKLSLDGIEKAHDALRDTPGSFDNVMKTYSAVSGLVDRYPNFELGINTVFCSQNQDDMEAIIGRVQGMSRIKTHTISLVRGDMADTGYAGIDTAKYFAAIRKLEHNLKQGLSPVYRFRGARIKAAQDILQRNMIHQTLLQSKRIIPCYAGRLNLVLNESGEVFPCELLSTSLGNVRDAGYDMHRVVSSKKADRMIASLQEECFCTHECYLMINLLFNPATYPSILKEYIHLLRQ